MTRFAIASLLAIAVGSVAVNVPVRAQPPGGDEDLPAVQLSGAGVEMLKLALPRSDGDSGAGETMSKDMDVTGLFQLLDPASFPAQLQSEGLGFSSALWSQVGAQAVIKMKLAGGVLEGRVLLTHATPSTSSPTTWSRRSPASRGCSARASHWRSPGTARTRSPSSTWTAGARRC
jgi:hypothetical protein